MTIIPSPFQHSFNIVILVQRLLSFLGVYSRKISGGSTIGYSRHWLEMIIYIPEPGRLGWRPQRLTRLST